MDVTEKILAEMPCSDPNYYPLSPTVDELEEYNDDLEYQGNHITIEWATREMLGHQMNWVRVGLVADRVRRYRLDRDKYPDWNTFCPEVLGKYSWQMKKTIDAALATMVLIEEGFSILTNCISQASKLIECCLKGETLLTDAWYLILEQLPAAHLITSNRIGEVLGFASEKKKISLSNDVRDRLQTSALNDGVSIDKKIQELLDMEDGIEPASDAELDETEPEFDDVKKELWYREMQEQIIEHDHQLWFLSAIAKIFNFAPILERVVHEGDPPRPHPSASWSVQLS